MACIAVRATLIATICSMSALTMAPLKAQSFEDLDAMSDASTEEKVGIQAARDQATRGEYLEALASLERVLAQHPKSVEGRLIHAIYLCKIDDVQGGLVEIDRMKAKEFGKELLQEARAICSKEEAA